jgi:subtilisin family serine protease
MEVRARAYFFSALIFLCACSNKSASTVFPESALGKDPPCTGEQIKTRFIVQWEDGHVTVVHSENRDVFMEKYLQPNVALIRHVEYDRRVTLRDQVQMVPQVTTFETNDWGHQIVQADAVWSQGVLGAGVKVGVVDAAVDYTHVQIAPRLDVNQAEANGVAGKDDDGNGHVDDIYGWDFYANKAQPDVSSTNIHGTHVAGIILADHTTGSMMGMAPKATLVPANFMDSSGGGNLGDAILAIKYVVSRGAKVINASWGGSYCSQSLRDTISSLNDQGVLFVVAAGNDGVSLDTNPEYPAAFGLPAQLTVGATRSTDMFAAFSNTSYTLVHLGAPGDGIYSTVPGGYAFLSGTSMATPFVTGAAALLWSAKPNATLAQIKQALLSSVDVKDYRVMTQGRLNVKAALDKIRQLVP